MSLLNGIIMSAATVLSLLGIMWIKFDGFLILIATLLPYSLTYYIAQFEQRYRYPVLWISLLLAAIGAELLIKHQRPRRSE